jgi:hypothetical protein
LLAFFAFEQLHAQVPSFMIFTVAISNEFLAAKSAGK